MIIKRIGGGYRNIYKQVSISANDGYWGSADTFDATYDNYFGRGASSVLFNMFARFTGIFIPPGAEILTATLSLYVVTKWGTPASNLLYFNDAAAPTAPTDATTANAKVKTTASYNCNPTTSGVWSVYDIKNIINELLTSYTSYSDGAMMAIIVGAGSSDNNYVRIGGFDVDSSLSPKLKITYR